MTMNNGEIISYIAGFAAENFPEFSDVKKLDATEVYHAAPINTYVQPIYTENNKEEYVLLKGLGLNTLANLPQSTFSSVDYTAPIGTISPIVVSNTEVMKSYKKSPASPLIKGIDVMGVRRDFPILSEKVDGKDLVWFDNAATTQKPKSVIDRISYFYTHENSNIHRGAHTLAARATDAYEQARNKVARFLNAPSADGIVFVRGTTEAINLVASAYGKKYIGKEDEIIISVLEHHANIVPWQLLCGETGAKLRVIPVDNSGQIVVSEYEKLFNSRTKFVSVTNVSNALGTITPIEELITIAHRHGVKILIDGAQSVSHIQTDVQSLDCDFFVFSGHKIYGPTGIGVLYGKKEVLQQMFPYQGGGNMIEDVTFEKTIYQTPPNKFEAGTGNIADAIGLGAALDYVDKVGIKSIYKYEHDLLNYATEVLKQVQDLKFVGCAKKRTSVLSFIIDSYTTEEIGNVLNVEGIAVRTGHHCAQPILRRFGLESVVRVSLAFYNTTGELDKLADVLKSFVKR